MAWPLLSLGCMLTLQENKAQNQIESQEISFPLKLNFPNGILGFEEIKEYSLQPLPDLDPFFWMEGAGNSEQSFLIVPPSHVVDTYSVEITEDDEEYLGLNSPQDAFILNIVTFSPNQSMTVNLKGPIVVNRHSFTAKQIVPRNAAVLPTSFPLNN